MFREARVLVDFPPGMQPLGLTLGSPSWLTLSDPGGLGHHHPQCVYFLGFGPEQHRGNSLAP